MSRYRRRLLPPLISITATLTAFTLACTGAGTPPSSELTTAETKSPDPMRTSAITESNPTQGAVLNKEVSPNDPEIPLGSLWYPVYGYERETGECIGGLGSAGWNEGAHGAPIMAEPFMGFYCFGDPEYWRTAIGLMRDHGLTWVLISWNGWGDVDLDGDIEAHDVRAAHEDIVEVFDYLARELEGEVRAALLVEPYFELGGLNSGQFSPEHQARVLDAIWNEVYAPHLKGVFQWKGKPLLVQWAPTDLGTDDRFTIRTFGSSPQPDEPALDWNWFPEPDKYPAMISEDGFVSFAPRFDEYFMWLRRSGPFHEAGSHPRRLDPYLEENVYGRFWDTMNENSDQVDLILIYSWNAYGEQAFIEPAVNGPLGSGGDDGMMLLKQTEERYARFLASR